MEPISWHRSEQHPEDWSSPLRRGRRRSDPDPPSTNRSQSAACTCRWWKLLGWWVLGSGRLHLSSWKIIKPLNSEDSDCSKPSASVSTTSSSPSLTKESSSLLPLSFFESWSPLTKNTRRYSDSAPSPRVLSRLAGCQGQPPDLWTL